MKNVVMDTTRSIETVKKPLDGSFREMRLKYFRESVEKE